MMKNDEPRSVGLYWHAATGRWRPCAPRDPRATRVERVDEHGRPLVWDRNGWRPATGVIPLDPAEVTAFLDGAS